MCLKKEQIIKGVLAADVANRCQLSEALFLAFVDQGIFPKPNMQIRSRQGYTDEQAALCVKAHKKIGGFFRITHLAKQVKCSTDQIRQWIKTDRISPPITQAFASKFYTGDEVSKIQKQIPKLIKEDKATSHKKASAGSTKRANDRYDARKKKGFFSTTDVAKMSGVAPVTINWHQSNGNIKWPKIKIKGYFGYYYTRNQADKIIAFFAKMKSSKEKVRAERLSKACRKKFFSSYETARLAGIASATMKNHQDCGNIDKPTFDVDKYNRKCYSRKQAIAIIAFFKKKRK